MTPKEQALQMIEGRIDTIQKLSIEVIEFIYIAAYNEAMKMLLNMQKNGIMVVLQELGS